MKKRKMLRSSVIVVIYFAAIIAVLFSAFFSCANVKEGKKTVTFTGTVLIEGNEPHTHVILEGPGPRKKRYMLEGELASELRNRYQHRSVTVVGYVTGKANPPLFPEKLKVISILGH